MTEPNEHDKTHPAGWPAPAGTAFVTFYAYDELNKLLAVDETRGGGSSGGGVTRYAYDGNRNKVAQQDADGNLTTYKYDPLDRLSDTFQHLVAGKITGQTRRGDDLGGDEATALHWHYEYDGNGNQTLILDAGHPIFDAQGMVIGHESQRIDITYDYLDREVLRTFSHYAEAGLDFQMKSITTTPDPNGNVVAVSEVKTVGGKDVTENYAYTYDALDRIESATNYEAKKVQYTYDKQGNKKSVTDPDGITTSYDYDARNRVITAHTAAGDTSYLYWEDSLLQAIIYPNGSVADYSFARNAGPKDNSYDSAGRLTRVVNHKGGLLSLGTDVAADVISSYRYEYDASGNRTKQTEVQHDLGGGAPQDTGYVYDNLNRLHRVTYPGSIDVTYEYEANGNRHREFGKDPTNAGNGLDRTYAYDRVNRLWSITNNKDSTQSIKFDYDANGNRISQAVGTVTTNLDANGFVVIDAMGHGEVTVNGGPAATPYHYGIRNELLQTAGTGGKLVRYDYDHDMLRVKKLLGQGFEGTEVRFLYDDQATLIEYGSKALFSVSVAKDDVAGDEAALDKGTVPQDLQAAFTNNQITLPQHHHVTGSGGVWAVVDDDSHSSFTVKEVTTTAGTVLEVFDTGTIRKYDYGDDLLSLTDVGPHGARTPLFYLRDGLGSTVNLTDTTDAITVSYRYDAWGNDLGTAGGSDNPMRYTGHYFDRETGLDYFGARYYDSTVGEFITQDPYLGNVNTPPSLHRYMYAYDNPLRYVDLTGYSPEEQGKSSGEGEGTASQGSDAEQAAKERERVKNAIAGPAARKYGIQLGQLKEGEVRILAQKVWEAKRSITGFADPGYEDMSTLPLAVVIHYIRMHVPVDDRTAWQKTKDYFRDKVSDAATVAEGAWDNSSIVKSLREQGQWAEEDLRRILREAFAGERSGGLSPRQQQLAAAGIRPDRPLGEVFSDTLAEATATAIDMGKDALVNYAENEFGAKAFEMIAVPMLGVLLSKGSKTTQVMRKALVRPTNSRLVREALGSQEEIMAAYFGLTEPLEAARYSGRAGDQWLHLRALSLGGPQEARNLVAGSAMANYQMMILEDGFLEAARAGKKVQVRVTATVLPGTQVGQSLRYEGWLSGRKVADVTFDLTSNKAVPGAEGFKDWWTKPPGTVSGLLQQGKKLLASVEILGLPLEGFPADVVQTTLSAAIFQWAAELHAPIPLSIRLQVEDLPGKELGEARVTQIGPDGLPTAGTIVISPNAAGAGWFIDPTPLTSEEFSQAVSPTAFQAAPGSPAYGKYDLLTVLLHEIGHLEGFLADDPVFASHTVQTVDGSQLFVGPNFTAALQPDGEHLSNSAYSNDLMNDTLTPSVRKLPSALDVQILDALWGPFTHSAVTASPTGPGTNGTAAPTHPVTWFVSDSATPSSARGGVLLGPAGTAVTETFGPAPAARPASVAALTGQPDGIVNGDFHVSDPGDPGFGWAVRGSGAVVAGAAVLNEDPRVFTGFSQTFVVPQGARKLQFTFSGVFRDNGRLNPPDAFEAALRDSATGQSLVGTAAGLTHTDAFLNVQSSGEIFVGPQVTSPAAAAPGQGGPPAQPGGLVFDPVTVTLDVSGIKAGTRATLDFDLLGFGPTTSSVTLSNVSIDRTLPPPPVANAGPDESADRVTAVHFAGSATGGLAPLKYAWTFGDGEGVSGTLTPTHLYQEAGTYTATLTVTDAAGRVSRSSDTVTVRGVAAKVDIGGPYSGEAGTAIAFGAKATDSPANTPRLKYVWDFGDRSTDTGPSPSHTYAAPGKYQVTLTVTDADGLTTVVSATVTVTPKLVLPPPPPPPIPPPLPPPLPPLPIPVPEGPVQTRVTHVAVASAAGSGSSGGAAAGETPLAVPLATAGSTSPAFTLVLAEAVPSFTVAGVTGLIERLGPETPAGGGDTEADDFWPWAAVEEGPLTAVAARDALFTPGPERLAGPAAGHSDVAFAELGHGREALPALDEEVVFRAARSLSGWGSAGQETGVVVLPAAGQAVALPEGTAPAAAAPWLLAGLLAGAWQAQTALVRPRARRKEPKGPWGTR
jgi:RHS repeat-associated protein